MFGRLFLAVLGLAIGAHATDWSVPEQELAQKVVALTGKAPISLSFENRSSLRRRDAEIIENGLRGSLAAMGPRVVENDASPITVAISLSENVTSYVWVAQVQRTGSEMAVAMVQIPRGAGVSSTRESVPLTLRKSLLWSQAEPILDVAVLEENARLAVLSPERVSVYRIRGGGSQLETSAQISHPRAWPRDLRGRILATKDHLLDVYLPGVVCHSSAIGTFSLNCQQESVAWPLMIAGPGAAGPGSQAMVGAYFEPSRDFFTGVETAPGGWLKIVPQFYSAALISRDKDVVWLFAAVDGRVHMVEGTMDRLTNLKWGSDFTAIRTSCGAGWQVLATSPAESATDSVRAYEIPERDPVPVSEAVDFSGPISALWTEARGDSAVAVMKNTETGNYEAFRLAVACGQ